jgi:hypothetical protein
VKILVTGLKNPTFDVCLFVVKFLFDDRITMKQQKLFSETSHAAALKKRHISVYV